MVIGRWPLRPGMLASRLGYGLAGVDEVRGFSSATIGCLGWVAFE